MDTKRTILILLIVSIVSWIGGYLLTNSYNFGFCYANFQTNTFDVSCHDSFERVRSTGTHLPHPSFHSPSIPRVEEIRCLVCSSCGITFHRLSQSRLRRPLFPIPRAGVPLGERPLCHHLPAYHSREIYFFAKKLKPRNLA